MAAAVVVLATNAGAHDPTGKWAAEIAAGRAPPAAWWNQLASGKGPCCDFADGKKVEDVDWDSWCEPRIASLSDMVCHYRVRLDGQWLEVPDDAVVNQPNRYGPAVVWPYLVSGKTAVRCFLKGTEG